MRLKIIIVLMFVLLMFTPVFVTSDNQTIIKHEFEKVKWGECPNTFTGLNSLYFFIAFVFGLFVVGMFAKNPALIYLSGFLMIFTTLIVWGCGVLFGIITIVSGLVFIVIGLSMHPLTK